jgi:hypothetical protein
MAVDKIKPLKYENPANGGTQVDLVPTETNPVQDYVAAKGMAFDGLDTRLIDTDASGNINFTDPNYTDIKLTTLRTPDKFFFAEAIAEQSTTGTVAVNALTLTVNQPIPAGQYLIQANWQWLCALTTSNFNLEFYMTVAAVKTLFSKQLESPPNGANYSQISAWKIVTLSAQNANNVVIKMDFWRSSGVATTACKIKEARLSFWRISD